LHDVLGEPGSLTAGRAELGEHVTQRGGVGQRGCLRQPERLGRTLGPGTHLLGLATEDDFRLVQGLVQVGGGADRVGGQLHGSGAGDRKAGGHRKAGGLRDAAHGGELPACGVDAVDHTARVGVDDDVQSGCHELLLITVAAIAM
jgi:hypothetical protein